DLDDTGGDFLTELEHILDLLDAFFADLRDVHESVDVVPEADERAEAGELGDVSGNEVADFVIFVDIRPGIFRKLFNADRDALVGFVDFQNDGLGFVPLFEDLARVIDFAGPGDLGDVHQAFDTGFKFDECAIRHQVYNLAFDPRADRIF